MNHRAGVGSFVAKVEGSSNTLHRQRIQGAPAEEVGFRVHERGVRDVQTGAAVEVDGGSAVGSDGADRVEVAGEDGAGALLDGGAGEVRAEQARGLTAVQEEVGVSQVRGNLEVGSREVKEDVVVVVVEEKGE